MISLGSVEANFVNKAQNKTYQRKSIYNIYKRRFQPIQRAKRHISTKLPFFPSVASTWEGDTMNRNPGSGRIRFWVQNCNGIKINDDMNCQHNFTQLMEYRINYCSFTETNMNINNPNSISKLHRLYRTRYPTGRMTITNTPHFPKNSHFQPGGVFSCFDSTLQTRFMSSTQDPLGRYHCHKFRGRERDIKIYTIYRVHRKSDDKAGLSTAWMQQRDILRKNNNMINPRDAVLLDIIVSIRRDLESNHSVILMGDFNETLDSREGTHETLTKLGLVNLMQDRMPGALPKTWNRGKAAIDHVYMTVDVIKAVKKAGYAPFDVVALSDHRGIFFDLDMRLLFDEELYSTVPAQFRRLQSSNVKSVQQYNKLFTQEWDKHRIDNRLETILMRIKKEGPTAELIKRLNNIDTQITEIMRFSEKKCSTISRHCVDPWSPQLKELSREIRYLIVQIKHTIRDEMSRSIVTCMHKVSNLNERLRFKRKEYREYIKKAAAHREMHLDERAQHHVMLGKYLSAASEIKRLKHIEVQKRDSRKIQYVLDNNKRDSATYILIPALSEYSNMATFNENIYCVQQMWNKIQIKGGADINNWIRITDKAVIEEILIQWQVLHFTQANDTPFTSEFWVEELQKDHVSESIINGTYKPPEDLPWEAQEVLCHMKRSQKIKEEVQAYSTFEEFRTFYKLATEATSSSPSGRHYGHFKALLESEKRFLQAIYDILNVCVVHSVILDRWKPTITSLIEKVPGVPYIHKYRTIHIIESDIQFVSKHIYVLGMMKQAEKYNLITDQQYGGRNRRQCQSAFINKICYYDISRQKIMACSFLDDDAVACYDRIVTELSEVEVQKWGVSKHAAKFTTKFLYSQKFSLKTVHGLSTKTYQHGSNCRVQGSGQGIGWSGPRWTASSDTISQIMSKRCTGMEFSDPTGSMNIRRNGDFFVDDLDIGVTEDAIKNSNKTTLQCLEEDEQIHSLVLNAEGGKLNPIKTSFYDIAYKRVGVRHEQMSNRENPGELHIRVEFNDDKKSIQRLEPTEASKALGIFLAPSGQYGKQYTMLDKKIRMWARNVRASSLLPREKLVAYNGYILRSILYVVAATNFTKEQCHQLQRIISPILYNALRVQRHASCIPLFTPKSLGGYGIVHIFHLQGIEKVKFYIMHQRLGDTTGKLLEISTYYTQMELGVSQPFWTLQYSTHSAYVTATWTTNIWDYLYQCGVKMIDEDHWVYPPTRYNDFHIMDVVLHSGLSQHQISVFNQIRMYMHVLTASDIYDDNTKSIKEHVYKCQSSLLSTLGWPRIKEFPKSWIAIWQIILKSLILPRLQANPLGKWLRMSHIVGSPVIVDDKASIEMYEQQQNKPTLKDFNVTSPKFANLVQAIQQKIKDSPKWLRLLWGSSKLSHRTIYQIIRNVLRDDLVIATDASVKYGRAAHVFCFARGRKGIVLFSTGSKVPGPIKFMTSYRAEMVSIMSAISLIDLVLTTAGITSHPITVYTDSETSITTSTNPRLNTLHYVISNDIDVALQLQHVCRNNKQVITLSHVHGHQENNTAFRDLPVPSQLNILMDRLSKKMVDDTFNSPNRITPLPAQRLYLIKTTPIVHDVANVLIIGEMERDIYGYYEKHHGVSPKQAKKIDWEALEQGTSSKNATSYKKTLHNFRNTMSINMKWGRIDSDVCPLCANSPETTIHLLSCPHEDVVAVRQQMISRFKDTMNKLNTAPEICEHWIKILTQYYDGIPISKSPITMNPTTWNIAQAHMTQADIGWDCFFFGE